MGTMSEMTSAGMTIVWGFMISPKPLVNRRLGLLKGKHFCNCAMTYFTVTGKEFRKTGEPAAGQKKQEYVDRFFQLNGIPKDRNQPSLPSEPSHFNFKPMMQVPVIVPDFRMPASARDCQ